MHLRQGSATRQGKSSKLASSIDIANAVARAPADAPASATSRLSQAPPLARRNARVLIAWAVPRRWEIQTIRRWIAEGVRTTDGPWRGRVARTGASLPGAVAVDIALPQPDGIGATRQITQRDGAKVPIPTMHADDVSVRQSLKAGPRLPAQKTPQPRTF